MAAISVIKRPLALILGLMIHIQPGDIDGSAEAKFIILGVGSRGHSGTPLASRPVEWADTRVIA